MEKEALAVLLDGVEALARQCGKQMLLEQQTSVFVKGTHDFVTERDLSISRFLSRELPALLPGSTVRSEEDDSTDRRGGPLQWIIDPIDGTTNYIYHFGSCAVSIGLVEEGRSVLGVIYAPFSGELYRAARGIGAFCNGTPIGVNSDRILSESLILVETNPYASRKKRTSFAMMRRMFDECIDLRIIGSAAIDLCYVAQGRASAFLAECLKPWDIAAGAVIVEEAGGWMSDWKGQPVQFESAGKVLASNPMLRKELLEALAPLDQMES